ncbi:hypothetical protein S40293_11539 [Stachybotrys chartarum IBT 40293]|nr:hypothetical protein S40293_11539 [Stachybotrys chartarum IBT 40293]
MLATTSQFLSFNENPSQCSALTREGRHCQRRISIKDQARRDPLTLALEDDPDDRTKVTELVHLFFCKGFHRPGGKFPIHESIHQAAVRLLLEQKNANSSIRILSLSTARTLSIEEVTASSSPPESSEPQTRQVSEVTPATEHRQRTSSIGTRRSARLQARDLTKYSQELTGTEVVQATLQPERATGSMNTYTFPRRSQRLRKGRPGQMFSGSSGGVVDAKRDRPVKIDERCPICTDSFNNPASVARCGNCTADCHAACLIRWWRNTPTCIQCRTAVSVADRTRLESVQA